MRIAWRVNCSSAPDRFHEAEAVKASYSTSDLRRMFGTIHKRMLRTGFLRERIIGHSIPEYMFGSAGTVAVAYVAMALWSSANFQTAGTKRPSASELVCPCISVVTPKYQEQTFSRVAASMQTRRSNEQEKWACRSNSPQAFRFRR